MLTPVDIQNTEFAKATFGYNKDQVDEFLVKVSEAFEKIYKENLELKEKVGETKESLKSYAEMEEALKNTLMFAQNTAEEVKKNAKEKAEVIVNEAQVKAQKITEESEKKITQYEMRIEALKNEFKTYKARIESVIDAEKKLLDDIID